MKKVVFTIILLYFTHCYSLCALKGPELFLYQNEWDFNQLSPELLAVQLVPIKNAGSKDLIIEKVVSSSPCIAPMLSEKTIKPGNVSVIRLYLSRYNTGPLNEKITILSNDPKSPRSIIKIKGEIIEHQNPKIELSGSAWNFGEIKHGSIVSHTFTLKNVGPAPLTIESIRHGCTCTTAEVSSDTIAPGKTSNIKMTFDSNGQKTGYFHQTSYVTFTSTVETPAKLRLMGVSL